MLTAAAATAMKDDQAFASPVPRCTMALSLIQLVAALTLNIVSLALPNWLRYQVDPSTTSTTTPTVNISNSIDYNTRNRGVFLTCLVDPGANVLKTVQYMGFVKYDSCLDMDLGNLNPTNPSSLGSDAWMIQTMRRLHLGLHLASGFCLCIALLLYIVCVSKRSLGRLYIAAGFSLIAAGLQFGAQISFNNTLMREMLAPGDGTRVAYNATYLTIYNAWPEVLKANTQVYQGASYYIALGSFGACLGSAGLNMLCAVTALGSAAAGYHRGDAVGDVNDSFQPTGSGAKVNGGRGDAMSNLSGGANVSVQSGRLPRIPVYQTYQAY